MLLVAPVSFESPLLLFTVVDASLELSISILMLLLLLERLISIELVLFRLAAGNSLSRWLLTLLSCWDRAAEPRIGCAHVCPAVADVAADGIVIALVFTIDFFDTYCNWIYVKYGTVHY